MFAFQVCTLRSRASSSSSKSSLPSVRSRRDDGGAEHATVTLKVTASMDGSIATAVGRVGGSLARRRARRDAQGHHDAILVGVGTLIADDRGLPVVSKQRRDIPCPWCWTPRAAPCQSRRSRTQRRLIYTGPRLRFRCHGGGDRGATRRVRQCVPESVLRDLQARGLGRVLVERGAKSVDRSLRAVG